MNNMFNAVNNQIEVGSKIAVAVSGGADSMVLLNLVLSAKKSKNFELLVIHVEHGIRGEESKRDAKFVQSFCQKHKVPCKVVETDILSLAKAQKQTVEECARNFRRTQFDELINQGFSVMLAHNKNDQAETVLMHIFRGSGIDGARGIVSRKEIIRPLLNFSKDEILEFAKQNNIEFVQDSTNDNTAYSRNYVRAEILPKILQIYPNIVDNLSKFALFCTESENLVNNCIDPLWIKNENNQVVVSKDCLSANSLVVAKVFKKAYNGCGEFSDLESKHIELISEFAFTASNGAVLNLPHGVVVENRNNNLLFYKSSSKGNSNFNFVIGENLLPSGEKIKVSVFDEEIEFKDGVYFVDYHKIPQNAVWRTRQNGDYFCKLGSRGRKKLNDYFTDKKLSLKQRDNTVLLANGNNILIVLGQDISEFVKIDSDTVDILKIDYGQK